MAPVLWLKLFSTSFLLLLCSSQTVLDVDELSVQYGIEITNKPVILNSQPVAENVLHLSSKHGQLYSCFLPQLPQVDDNEQGKGKPLENVVDILDKSLNGTCLTHKKGWWTYKLCHKKSITQYHVAEIGDVVGPTTTLGLFSSEDDWSKEEVMQRKPSEIFHSHQYVNGTMCDVTRSSRKSTVQYFCATKPSDDIIRIEEPATCEYIITVHSTKLCTHTLFSKKEATKQINLVCSPALMEHEYNKYMEKLNKKKAAEEERKKEVLKKKMELDEAEKKTKGNLSADKLLYKDGSSVKGELKQFNDKKDENGLKGAMNDISSFMKGFMKVLNIKSDDVKLTTKIMKDGQEVTSVKEGVDMDELASEFNDLATKGVNKVKDAIGSGEKEKKEDESVKGSAANLNTNEDIERSTKMIRDSVSDTDTNIDPDDDDNDLMKDADASKETVPPENEKIEKSGSLKYLNDITESMIKQLEQDSNRMQKKSVKERQAMHEEFDKVRNNAAKELEKSKNMLNILESLKNDRKNTQSRNEIDKQIKSVQALVGKFQEQIITIDQRRKIVDEFEKDTNKRLDDINKKIVSTKTAHKFAKSLEHMTNEENADDYFNKIITGIFDKDMDKTGTKRKKGEKPENAASDDDDDDDDDDEDKLDDDDEDNAEKKLPEKVLDEQNTLLKDLPAQSEETKTIPTISEERHSKLVKGMLDNLKDQVGKLHQDSKIKKSGKSDAGAEKEKVVIDTPNSELDMNSNVKGESDIGKKTELNTLVNTLKKEMVKLSENIKKEKENVSPSARSKDKKEKEIIEDIEKDAKNKMEVRIRTIDEKAGDKDFDVADNVREEVKEATKRMEDTVRKQLKDAGLDFGDNIKIKIITTKDKFDQFSSAKDVKLLSDDDAADFKDLLLGFLGGGKEKVTEEERQRTLEDNYNFVLNDDED